MMARLLTLGFIGIVLINVGEGELDLEDIAVNNILNEVAGSIDEQNGGGGFIVVKIPKDYGPNDMGEEDYVDENSDDLVPSGKPKVYDPRDEFDPALNVVYSNDNGPQDTEKKPTISSHSEEPNIATEKPKQTEKTPINAETTVSPGFSCTFELCKTIYKAWKSAHKDMEKNLELLVNAGTRGLEAKMKFLQSLPDVGHTFFRTLMNR